MSEKKKSGEIYEVKYKYTIVRI